MNQTPSSADPISGFAPLGSLNAHVLILGSVPSVASLEQHQYYGNPRNAFWRIMGDLFAASPDLPYPQRAAKLSVAGVAVWDVIASCVRPGSLDSDINVQSVQVNDFVSLFSRQSQIRHVFFNGRKAGDMWRRFVQDDIDKLRRDIVYTTLPSTSPAMASLNYPEKLKEWQAISAVLAQTKNSEQ